MLTRDLHGAVVGGGEGHALLPVHGDVSDRLQVITIITRRRTLILVTLAIQIIIAKLPRSDSRSTATSRTACRRMHYVYIYIYRERDIDRERERSYQ